LWIDIHSKIMTVNRAYLAHIELFRSKLTHKNSKLKLYKILIQPMLVYESETGRNLRQSPRKKGKCSEYLYRRS